MSRAISVEAYRRMLKTASRKGGRHNKFGVSSKEKRTRGPILFASHLEARVYDRLLLEVEAGTIAYFLRQVPLHLPGNTKYVVDFQVFRPDGSVEYLDAKGTRTKEFVRNKKQVEDLYPIEIQEITK